MILGALALLVAAGDARPPALLFRLTLPFFQQRRREMNCTKYIEVSFIQAQLKIPFNTLLALIRKGCLPAFTHNRGEKVFKRTEIFPCLKVFALAKEERKRRRPRQREEGPE